VPLISNNPVIVTLSIGTADLRLRLIVYFPDLPAKSLISAFTDVRPGGRRPLFFRGFPEAKQIATRHPCLREEPASETLHRSGGQQANEDETFDAARRRLD